MNMDSTLLPGWVTWDTSRYNLPAKTITLKDGSIGSVIVGSEGIAVYSKSLEVLAGEDDMGSFFLEIGKEGAIDPLLNLLSDDDIAESKIVFAQYSEHQTFD